MASVPKYAHFAARWGILGFVSGLLSCEMSQSYIIVRDQRTLDHIIWPGMVFAVVVLVPISRWAGDSWTRTVAALVASSVIYPIAWRIAVWGVPRSGAAMIATFGFSGFLGSFVLAWVFLFGRPRWMRAACATVILGALIGGLMGAQLRAAANGIGLLFTAREGLGVSLVVWQAVVGALLARGVLMSSSRPVTATSAAPDSGDSKP